METTATTLGPNPEYHPFTSEEYNELKEVMNSITSYIPDNRMGFVWNHYKRINAGAGTQPCGCPSAAGYWRDAVNALNNFITETEKKNG